MCGIGGVFYSSQGVETSSSTIQSMLQTLLQRGPDGNGHWQCGGATLIHTRLSIIDTSEASAQPMLYDNGRYVFVYNGELFNYKQLRNTLQSEGEIFSTSGDAEVVFRWFLRKGVEGLSQLNGFFAFAVYDKQLHEIWLVRDALGEKPLYLGTDAANGIFYFGSRLRTLYAAGMPWRLHEDALHLYFHLSYIPAPYTAVQNVQKIMPATAIHITASKTHVHKYNVHHASFTNEISDETVKTTLKQAVEKRMVSDVPVAAFLSGGIDSSIVCALAREINPTIHTYSASFPGNGIFDESKQAASTAAALNLAHTAVPLTQQAMLQTVEEMLHAPDEPYADSSAIALYTLCTQLKGKYKVVLSGDGADELFAGYNKHRAEWRLRTRGFTGPKAWMASAISRLPSNRHSRLGNLSRSVKKLKKGAALNPVERYWTWAGHGEQRAPFTRNASAEFERMKQHCLQYMAEANDMEHVLLNDVHLVMVNDMLYKTDFAGMQNAVEIRSPFLDPNVVSLAFSLPANQKVDTGKGKKILRSAFASVLPAEIFSRPKHGFEVPLRQWLTGVLHEELQKSLHETDEVHYALPDKNTLTQWYKKLHSANPGDVHASLWAWMIFNRFYRSYQWKK